MPTNLAETLEEMGEAQRAPSKTSSKTGLVDLENVGEQVGELSGPGLFFLWRNDTGERIVCDKNMLPIHLSKRVNGKKVFSISNPHITPRVGQLKCYLHPDNENRSYYESIGFPICKKSNLISKFHLEQHMVHRHKVEWSTIQAEQKEDEKREDHKLQNALLEAAIKGVTQTASNVPVSEPRRRRRTKTA